MRAKHHFENLFEFESFDLAKDDMKDKTLRDTKRNQIFQFSKTQIVFSKPQFTLGLLTWVVHLTLD